MRSIYSIVNGFKNKFLKLGFPWVSASAPAGVDSIVKENSLGASYDTDWARRPAARLARAVIVETLMRPVMSFLAMPTRKGIDRLGNLEGPAIFAANHQSHADTPLLITSIPEPWRHELVIGAAADYFFNTKATSAISALAIGAVPIDRTKVSRQSGDMISELIEEGWSLLIYPEGGRSPDGWGQPFRGGAAYLAIRCDVPVIPVHISGTAKILRKGRNLPRRSKSTVTFGYPMKPESDESARSFSARIEKEVRSLADETASSWWDARQRSYRNSSPSLTGPEIGAWRRSWALSDNDGKTRKRRRRWPAI
tara:strand:- start:12 stop:941 length:930 start_codon:yes stop_codon:yes gene_type:complete